MEVEKHFVINVLNIYIAHILTKDLGKKCSYFINIPFL